MNAEVLCQRCGAVPVHQHRPQRAIGVRVAGGEGHHVVGRKCHSVVFNDGEFLGQVMQAGGGLLKRKGAGVRHGKGGSVTTVRIRGLAGQCALSKAR